jgi:hypothetical protein
MGRERRTATNGRWCRSGSFGSFRAFLLQHADLGLQSNLLTARSPPEFARIE